MKYLKLFTNFLQTLGELQDDEVGRLFRAMLKYAEDGSEPVLCGNERFVWGAAKLHMDMASKYSERKSAAGSIGGSNDKQTQANASKYKQEQANASNDKLKEKKRKEYKEILSKESTKKEEFIIPSLEEVKAYVLSTGLHMDAEDFYDYYSSKHWKTSNGKEPMKDWQLTARRWARREKKFHGNAPQSSQYKNEDLEKLEVKLV